LQKLNIKNFPLNELPSLFIILLTIPRSGSTWLTDALRCHPAIEFLPSGSILKALDFNKKIWGRYPRDLSNTPNATQSIEITDGKWGHIPQFDVTNQLCECPEKFFREAFSIEKIHPEFFDFNTTAFLENLKKIEARGIKIRLVYLVRDPEASFTSFMNYQERNSSWNPKTRNDSLATYMLKTYDVILKTANSKEGLIIDYRDVKTNFPYILQKIYHYLWPDVNEKEMDFIIQVSHAANLATARDKRLAISNSSFLGSTIGSIQGGADKHRDFFNLYKNKVEICYNSYHSLLNKNSKQYQIENELDNQLLLGEKLFNEGKHNEAEIILKNILNEEPSHSIAHNNLGCLLWQTNRKLEAITEFKKAFELTPNNPDVVWNIGQSFIEIGYLNEAINLYQTYLNINPNDKRILKAIQNYKEQDLEDKIWLIINKKDIIKNIIDDIKKRLAFYAPHIPANRVEIVSEFPQKALSDKNAILLFGSSDLIPNEVTKVRVFNIDYRHNPTDGWDWCKLANYCSNHKVNIEESKLRFTNYINKLKKEPFSKAYIFGTGPSLEKAIKRDWSDGYRIVCNTIVRDPVLWKHINPHFIVAGDAIYHFGHTEFAQSFRQDLAKRLNETETYFLYPEFFHEIVRREFNEFFDRLIPVPKERNQQINVDLSQYFALPALHNVLALLLLPLACTMSKNICLWGFDGRAPDDKLFWNNSKKHSYPEFIPKLQKAHPCFFNYFVPKADTGKYTQIAFGDQLDKFLKQAESEGFTFVMMHKSWTPNLQKRYQKKIVL